jgi:calcyclin binding protein
VEGRQQEHVDELDGQEPEQNRDKKSSDPTAGIMDMMKDMYEDGDEDMKRTIAKAWSESREKQQKGGDMF